jgi:hypothetical protein
MSCAEVDTSPLIFMITFSPGAYRTLSVNKLTVLSWRTGALSVVGSDVLHPEMQLIIRKILVTKYRMNKYG